MFRRTTCRRPRTPRRPRPIRRKRARRRRAPVAAAAAAAAERRAGPFGPAGEPGPKGPGLRTGSARLEARGWKLEAERTMRARMDVVLFACVANAGRSQMAAAFFDQLADPQRARALS